MAEPFRFNFAETTLESWQKARQLKENQRQFDLETARQERQDSLMAMFKQRDYLLDVAKYELDVDRQRIADNRLLVDLAEDFDIYSTTDFAPGIGGKIMPNGAIQGESILGNIGKGKIFIRKPVKQANPKDVLLGYGKIPNAPYPGEIYGYIDETGNEVITRFEQNKPSAFSALNEAIKGNTLELQELRKNQMSAEERANIEKKQATYDDIMNSPYRQTTDEDGNVTGGYYYDRKTERKFKNSDELRRYAIDVAGKTGLPGRINKWGRVKQADGTITTLSEADYVNKVIKDKSSKPTQSNTANTKVMTKQEFIEDFNKEEGRKPSAQELNEFKKLGIWK